MKKDWHHSAVATFLITYYADKDLDISAASQVLFKPLCRRFASILYPKNVCQNFNAANVHFFWTGPAKGILKYKISSFNYVSTHGTSMNKIGKVSDEDLVLALYSDNFLLTYWFYL